MCSHDCGGGTCVPILADAGAPDCSALAAAIGQELQATNRSTCTGIVRLEYQSLRPLAHAFVCAQYASTNESSARATANVDTTYGNGTLVSGANPTDEWVFYTAPGDFGGVSAVSARSGRTVFGGAVVWSGTGEVNYPKLWLAGDIGIACGSSSISSVRGFDMRGGAALPGSEMDMALAVVFDSAFALAMRSWGILSDAMVLLYPRTVGDFDPANAEYGSTCRVRSIHKRGRI